MRQPHKSVTHKICKNGLKNTDASCSGMLYSIASLHTSRTQGKAGWTLCFMKGNKRKLDLLPLHLAQGNRAHVGFVESTACVVFEKGEKLSVLVQFILWQPMLCLGLMAWGPFP